MTTLHRRTAILCGLLLIPALCIGIFFWWKQLYIVVDNQAQDVTIHIKKIYFPRGGFFEIKRAGYIGNETVVMAQSEYIPSGTYKAFDTSYTASILSLTPGPYRIKMSLIEDRNNNKLYDQEDRVMRSFLGTPLSTYFTLTQNDTQSVSCDDGYEDTFPSTTLDLDKWRSSIYTSQRDGLYQKAQYNGPDGGSSFLFSRKGYTGDLEIEAEILGFTTEVERTQGYAAWLELTTKIFSVAWFKDANGSYLVARADYQDTSALPKLDISSSTSVKIKLIRRNTVGEIWVDTGNGYTRVWMLTNLPVVDIYVGMLLSDRGDIPQRVDSHIRSISIHCPTQ